MNRSDVFREWKLATLISGGDLHAHCAYRRLPAVISNGEANVRLPSASRRLPAVISNGEANVRLPSPSRKQAFSFVRSRKQARIAPK